jgi:hypothetical protein
MSPTKMFLAAATLVAVTGTASAAPLGAVAPDTGAALKTEAQNNSAVEKARWVCRYGYHGRRCWWEPPRPHFGLYWGPRRHSGHWGHRRWF